jgi:hypothetical protein
MSDLLGPVEPNKTPQSEPPVLQFLEKGDGMAHILVAILLLFLALAVVLDSTLHFLGQFTRGTSGDSFAENGLTYLSGLLLGVIILELLSTILTYIRARNLEATIKDFLIVGLISSVRKILLVGAQSSIVTASGKDAGGKGFLEESLGTVVSIVGILLLIGGLLMLDRRNKVPK